MKLGWFREVGIDFPYPATSENVIEKSQMEYVMKTATKTSKRPQTQNAGASLERQSIRKKVRQMANEVGPGEVFKALVELGEWIDGRPFRNSKIPGGLGKKKSK